MFANLFYKADVESFVPIWDGKIEGVVTEIGKIKKHLEKVDANQAEVDARLKKLEKSQNRR